MSKAVVKIVAGEELGIGPMASMTGIHIIEGKPSLSANLLGVQVKRSERYDYRPTELSDEKVVVTFYEGAEVLGESEFTIAQAQKIEVKQKGSWIKLAETGRWKNYPQAMLFARALSQGVRLYCPDVTAGTPAYTPEELGAEVDEQGEVVVVQPEAETLSPDTVEHLAKGIDAAGLTLDDLNIVLGALGIDALDPTKDRNEQLAELTEEQAAALDADLQARVDAEETPDGRAADAMAEAFAEGEEADDAGE